MSTNLILGTAGHIDHGKTSLIKALTGVNTDRLPEEKKRGITIELGFAHLTLGDYNLGIVDVPGHERFVRNMLAGATGMDLAMLVVAADDSVNQQTLEHLEILRFLNLPAGVIAITKVDMVEADWAEMVQEEVRELVKGTFLQDAPIVPTSSHTGVGIEELKSQLIAAADKATNSDRLLMGNAPFRMAIDRTFSIEGHGTIVTGSVASGEVNVGDELLIQPGQIPVRVRGIQNHDQSSEIASRGQRAAINLAGIHHDETSRGQELAANGYLKPSKIVTVNLRTLDENKKPLKDRTVCRLHVGTAEILCTVRLLDRDLIEPGEECVVQLFLNEPAVMIWNQPFVLRSESPVTTIGGGQILDSNANRVKKSDELYIEKLRLLKSDDAFVRASAITFVAGLSELSPDDFVRRAGIQNAAEMRERLISEKVLAVFKLSQTRNAYIHRDTLKILSDRIAAALQKLHEQNPLRSSFEKQSFLSGFSYLGESNLLDSLIKHMSQEKVVKSTARGLSLVGHGPSLSKNEANLLMQMVEWFREAGIESPSADACKKRATKNKESVPQLLQLAVNDGDLVEVAPDYFLHIETETQIKSVLREKLFDSKTHVAMSEIRDVLDTTRKYAVPICEYLDSIGFTRREEELRVLVEAEQSAAQ